MEQGLEQWCPTAGPWIGAGPRKFFAGPQNILLPAHHCKVFVNYETHFVFNQFLVNKTGVSLLPIHNSSKMSAHVTVIQRKKS